MLRTIVMLLPIALFAGCNLPGRTPASKRPAMLQGVTDILFVGDSLTDGSSYPDYVVNTLNREMPDANFRMHNVGVAGNTAADVRARMEEDIIARDADLMILCIGTNDCWRNRPVADYEADVKHIVSRTIGTGTRVMLVRPSPFGGPMAHKDAAFVEGYLGALRRTADIYSLPVADAHGEFIRGEQAGRDMLGPDGIHHGRDGFEGMARAILDKLGLADVDIDLTIRPHPFTLTDWESSAPIAKANTYSLDQAKDWRPYDAAALMAEQAWYDKPFPARGAWMPFVAPDAKRVGFGRTHFDAPKAGEYELQVGGSPVPQIVWINGEKVWEAKRPHGYHPNADRLPVTLRDGSNEIVVVSNYMIFVGIRPLDD